MAHSFLSSRGSSLSFRSPSGFLSDSDGSPFAPLAPLHTSNHPHAPRPGAPPPTPPSLRRLPFGPPLRPVAFRPCPLTTQGRAGDADTVVEAPKRQGRAERDEGPTGRSHGGAGRPESSLGPRPGPAAWVRSSPRPLRVKGLFRPAPRRFRCGPAVGGSVDSQALSPAAAGARVCGAVRGGSRPCFWARGCEVGLRRRGAAGRRACVGWT